MAFIDMRNRNGDVVAQARVDDACFDLLNQWHWSLLSGYASRGVMDNGRIFQILMHRFILGLKPADKRCADHINRDRLDNRRENLRILTKGQNTQNTAGWRKSKSGLRGVHYHAPNNKWLARVQIDGTRHCLGSYETPEEAAEVAAAFRAKHMPFSEEALAGDWDVVFDLPKGERVHS